MSVVETLTFRLAADTDEAEFLDADRRVQTEFVPNLTGFMRRTTARGRDGEWLVVVLWGSESDAEAASELARDNSATNAFDALLDASTVEMKRYSTLD